MKTTEVTVRQAVLEIRTVKLSKALLKQFRRLTSLPESWTMRDEQGNLRCKPEYLVGWFHGSVLGDEFGGYTLYQNGKGDYFVQNYVDNYVKQQCKQIYIL